MTNNFSPNLCYVDSFKELQAFWEWLDKKDPGTPLGLDTETGHADDTDPKRTNNDLALRWASTGFRLRMVQVGDETAGWAFRADGWEGPIREILERWRGPWVLHNVSFDAKVLKRLYGWDIPWERTHDTMIMKLLKDPGQPAGLKDSASKLVTNHVSIGEKRLKEDMKKNGWTWSTVPYTLPSYWQYSALDPCIAVALYNKLKPVVDSMPEAYDLEMGVLRCAVNMEYKGMSLDTDYVETQYKAHQEKLDKMESFMKESWNLEPSKNAQVIDKLRSLGAEFTEKTPKGEDSANAAQMKLFKESDNKGISTIANGILMYRDLVKTTNTYFKGYLTDKAIEGRIYANLNTLRAKTGRMSSSNPNLQNLPSKAKVIKDAFIPDDPANQYLMSVDYSSMELRMLANLSKDPNLIEAYRKVDEHGEDFFVNIAKLVYNDSSFQKSDPRRKLIKGYMYGMLYGAGLEKLAETAGTSVQEAEVLDRKIKDSYPGIELFMDGTMNTGEKTLEEHGKPFIMFPDGRKIPAEKDERGNWKIYALTNYMIQGLSAVETKKAIVRLDNAGFDLRMAIHDEVISIIDQSDEKEARKDFEDIMTVKKSDDFPVAVWAESDPGLLRWGDKYA